MPTLSELLKDVSLDDFLWDDPVGPVGQARLQGVAPGDIIPGSPLIEQVLDEIDYGAGKESDLIWRFCSGIAQVLTYLSTREKELAARANK